MICKYVFISPFTYTKLSAKKYQKWPVNSDYAPHINVNICLQITCKSILGFHIVLTNVELHYYGLLSVQQKKSKKILFFVQCT